MSVTINPEGVQLVPGDMAHVGITLRETGLDVRAIGFTDYWSVAAYLEAVVVELTEIAEDHEALQQTNESSVAHSNGPTIGESATLDETNESSFDRADGITLLEGDAVKLGMSRVEIPGTIRAHIIDELMKCGVEAAHAPDLVDAVGLLATSGALTLDESISTSARAYNQMGLGDSVMRTQDKEILVARQAAAAQAGKAGDFGPVADLLDRNTLDETRDSSIRPGRAEEAGEHEHRPVQHRDNKEPWCGECGLTSDYVTPRTRKPRGFNPRPR